MYMELLEQCQIWNENNEYQKIIDAIEAPVSYTHLDVYKRQHLGCGC